MNRRDHELRNRILAEASIIIRRQGPIRWSMDHLAWRIGIAKSTLYRVIGSRDQLVEQASIARINQDIPRRKDFDPYRPRRMKG
jgi:AcrR family transcriptional regulator